MTQGIFTTLHLDLANAVKVYRWRKMTSSKKFFRQIQEMRTNAEIRGIHIRRGDVGTNAHERGNKRLYADVYRPPVTYHAVDANEALRNILSEDAADTVAPNTHKYTP